MREIKFRAWDSDVKEMSHSNGLTQILYGGASDDIGLGLSLHWSVKNSYRAWHRNRSFIGDYEKGIIILMQYTGLKDKNGKEIYENDIVVGKFYNSDFGVIKWLNERCGFYIITDGVGSDIVNRKPFQTAYKMNSCKLEIIGNLYENPELLNK